MLWEVRKLNIEFMKIIFENVQTAAQAAQIEPIPLIAEQGQSRTAGFDALVFR